MYEEHKPYGSHNSYEEYKPYGSHNSYEKPKYEEHKPYGSSMSYESKPYTNSGYTYNWSRLDYLYKSYCHLSDINKS